MDENGRVYNIEIQRSNRGTNIKRARYNSSLLDANITEPGDNYEKLAETYVIFITENDVLKAGLPIYHIDRIIKETGVEVMCKAMEDMRKEAAAEQNIITLLETLRNLMKNLGLTAEQAMTAMGVSDTEKGILIKKI